MASNRIVGITIDIEGKSDGLTKSLQQVTKESAATTSALKSIDSALKEVTDEGQRVELLSQKEELLTKQIEQTNQKLEIMKQVAADAAKGLEDGTVSKEQYAVLTAEIAKTEQTLEQMGNQATATSDELSGIESGDLDQVGDDAETAAEGLEDAADEADNTNTSFDALAKGAAAVGAAMVAATAAMVDAIKEVGGALVDCTMDAANYADEIATMSTVTGLSTDTLQELNYASELLDVSVDTITGSMTKMEKTMSSAADSNEKYKEQVAELQEKLKEGKITQDEFEVAVEEAGEKTATAYDALGISIQNADGSFRSAEDVFWDTIDALGKIEDPVQRDLLAMELMGKSAKDLNPLIEAGSESFRQLAEEAHETGYVMSGDTLDAFTDFDDQMQRFKNSGTAAKNALGTLLLPALSELSGTGTNALTKFTKAVQESNGDVSVIGNAISEMLPEVLGSINSVLPDILSLVGTAVDSLLQILIDNLPLFVDSAISIIEQLTTTLINPENIAKIMDAAVTIVLSLVQFLLANADQIINSAIQIILALVNGLSQALPQLIPAAVDAILTICETLLAPENLALILDAALNLVIGLTTGIIDSLPQLIERLPEIISGIVDFLLSEEGLGKLISTGFDLFVGLITKMPDVVIEILGAVGDLILDIVSKIGELGGQVWDAMKSMFPSLDDVTKWGWDMIQGIIDGITGALGDLWDCCTDVASGIADFLGFSKPKVGPMSDADKWGPDMMQLYGEGIESGIPGLLDDVDLAANAIKQSVTADFDISGAAMENTMNIVASGAANDYTDQLGMISGSLSVLAGGDRQIVVPVYIGSERLETVIANANVNNNFISGGR